MPLNLEQFERALVTSQLMSAEEVAAFFAEFPPVAGPEGVQQLARDLVRQGKLTRFQATQVYQGAIANLVLGDYCILERIGQGGMGQVYKAQHRRMKRVVALKLLSPKITADPNSVKRFQREVEAAARLSHPNIVTAYDAGQQGATHYLIMEYVDGSDLSSAVKQGGPLACDVAIKFLLQAAAALEHAHNEGIIHRDIKPGNLLVDKKGNIKILDMGLARFDNPLLKAAADQDLTNSGMIMGTIDYMSPEQALDTRQADQRSDIYSLGCTLYYLLTGNKMFPGDTLMKRIVKHREAPPPPLVSTIDDLPPGLEQVYRKMVAKKPADRYQTVGEVRRALEACLARAFVALEEPHASLGAGDDDGLAKFLSGLSEQERSGSHRSAARGAETLSRQSDQDTDGSLNAASSSSLSMARQRKNRTSLIIASILAFAVIVAIVVFWATRG